MRVRVRVRACVCVCARVCVHGCVCAPCLVVLPPQVTAAYIAAADGTGPPLTLSVLDAPVPLPPHLLPGEGCPLTAGSAGVALVASPNPAYTPLHVDPAKDGGGWMYLLEGRKQWLLVSQRHLERLVVPGPKPEEDPADLADAEAVLIPRLMDAARADRAAGEAVPGVWEAVCGPGSLLYFPLGTAHKVWTSAPSFGLGGYMLVEQERGQPQADLTARMAACKYV